IWRIIKTLSCRWPTSFSDDDLKIAVHFLKVRSNIKEIVSDRINRFVNSFSYGIIVWIYIAIDKVRLPSNIGQYIVHFCSRGGDDTANVNPCSNLETHAMCPLLTVPNHSENFTSLICISEVFICDRDTPNGSTENSVC